METLIITGANRGIGLALTKAFLQKSDIQILATARNPQAADELNKLAESAKKSLSIFPLDIDSDESIANFVSLVSEQTDKVDLLINNAGIGGGLDSIEKVERKAMEKVILTNSVSPMLVTKALLPLLRKSENGRIVNISSILGSIGSRSDKDLFLSYNYATSKCALNMASTVLAEELKKENIGVLILHPGWVKTDMGGQEAPMKPEESAQLILERIESFKFEDSGAYLSPDGNPLPW